MTTAEQVLRTDLDGTKVQLGIENGRWRIVRLEWPYLYVAFSARPVPGNPDEYLVQFDCTPYPAAVRGVFWGDTAKTELDATLWPRLVGDEAFKPGYQPRGRTALYLACDGETQLTKPQWQTEHALEWWGSRSDITLYFGVINVRLHSQRYCGNGNSASSLAHQ